jgi:hypothetical protein
MITHKHQADKQKQNQVGKSRSLMAGVPRSALVRFSSAQRCQVWATKRGIPALRSAQYDNSSYVHY